MKLIGSLLVLLLCVAVIQDWAGARGMYERGSGWVVDQVVERRMEKVERRLDRARPAPSPSPSPS